MMNKSFTFVYIFLFIFIIKANAQKKLKVGLFQSSKIDLLEIRIDEGTILIKADFTNFSLPLNSILNIASIGSKICLSTGKINLGVFKNVEIEIPQKTSVVLKPLSPNYPENRYTEKLLIRSNQNKLSLINSISMENYVVGVLRGEIGYDKPFYSYVVLAILAQTYAEGYYSRHRSEGFNLCDQVHCQVFKGYFKYEHYHQAADLARDKVVLDANGNIIEGLFHSNCGGITQYASDVWKNDLNYCKSIEDTFCKNQKNSAWSKVFSINDFCLKLNIPFSDDSADKEIFSDNTFVKNDKRLKDITLMNKSFNTLFIRTQLNLKSNWFEIKCNGDSVLISGKGFGHGVGLCQEGCMVMAKQGCNEEEIIHYYFNNVIITDRNKLRINN